LIGEKGSDTVGQNDEPLDVEIVLGLSVDRNIMTKVFSSLSKIPEISSFKTAGSSSKGVVINTVMNKSIPLAEMLSLQIPEAHIINEPAGKNGNKQKLTRISITRAGS